MRKIIVTAFAFMMLLNFCDAQTSKKKTAPIKKNKPKSELKSGIKEGWHGVKSAGRAVGHTSKRAAKSVGHGTKKIVKDVKNDVKK